MSMPGVASFSIRRCSTPPMNMNATTHPNQYPESHTKRMTIPIRSQSMFCHSKKVGALLSAWITAFLMFLASSEQVFSQAAQLPPAEVCFQAQTGIAGMVGTLGAITGGTGGTAGTYTNIALTGGSGSGATANITVSGGAVTAVVIFNPGTLYKVGDVLSAASGNIGGTTGFSVPVASLSINSSL